MSNHITIAVTPQQLAILMNQQNSTHGATRLVVATNNGEFRAMTPADVFASRGSYNAQPAIHQPGRIVIHQQPSYIPGGYIEPSGQAICNAYRAQDRINRLFR